MITYKKIGSSKALPSTFSYNNIKKQAKKCNPTKAIMEVRFAGGQTLNLLKDYGRTSSMDALKQQLCQDCTCNPPSTTIAEVCASINSMFVCIQKSGKSNASTKLLNQATSIDCDGQVAKSSNFHRLRWPGHAQANY
jgi:hypothetical protein